MATDFQPQRLSVRPHKTLATAGLLSALLAVQILAGTAMAESTHKDPSQPSLDPASKQKAPKEMPKQSTLVPLINEKSPNKIPGQYIVIFKPGTKRDAVLAAQKLIVQKNKSEELRGTIRTTYTSGLLGFSAHLSESTLKDLRTNSNVDYIEVNQTGWFNRVQCRDQSQSCQCGAQPCSPAIEPPTGLDRISERGILPLNNPYNPLRLDGRYSYSEDGTGVHVYVIDSGIDNTHAEFGQRVEQGIKVTSTTTPTTPPSNLSETQDCNTHGTHVAGIIGGNTVGVAKGVTLHPVRVNGNGNGCGDSTLDLVINGVLWVKDNAIRPAVVNLSVSFWTEPQAQRTALKQAVIASIDSGITHVIAAGNHNVDACAVVPTLNYWESPAMVNQDIRNRAIVVGAFDPNTDTRWAVGSSLLGSNFGPCLSLFAPGVNIRSARSNQAQVQNPPPGGTDLVDTGTSQAAAYVTGVVARILRRNQTPPTTPEAVWCAMHLANNTDGPRQGVICSPEPTPTANWQGVTNRETGSPNEMLHYGSRNNGINDGDPHITTINGIHYDFQDAGEFVALRDANGMEIQTRQTPVANVPWVSVNTAIAARVGKHRVTWQPGPNGLELRLDGALTPIGENGLDLGNGGRIMKSAAGDTLEVDFPDGTALLVTSHWWAGQSQSYLTVQVFNTPATEGIMGMVEQDSWLQPEFAETWRVTNEISLFDYAPSLSTKTFTRKNFPKENIPPVNSEVLALARRVCEANIDLAGDDHNMLADCAFDMAVTGDPIFAKSLRIDQRIQRGATNTTVGDDRNLTRVGEEVTFTATVARHGSEKSIPTGRVTFLLDGKELGKPVMLDSNGQAQWKMSRLRVGGHRVSAQYIPDKDSVFLPSTSLDKKLTVEKRPIPHGRADPKKLYRK
jgi:subtilisin family serine protease